MQEYFTFIKVWLFTIICSLRTLNIFHMCNSCGLSNIDFTVGTNGTKSLDLAGEFITSPLREIITWDLIPQ